MHERMISQEEKIEKTIRSLSEKNQVKFQINALTRKGREELMEIFSNIFIRFSLNMEYMFNIYSALVEVIFNAVKANVKYILFQEVIKNRISSSVKDHEIDEVLNSILREEPLREFMARYVPQDLLKKQTQNLLKIDEYFRLKKDVTESEKEKLKEFRTRLAKRDVNIQFKILLDEEDLIFIIVNDSPVLKKDMDRIHHSREIHAALAEAGQSGDFFSPENLDQTESAGMGIAMADEVYYEMKLNPFEYFSIVTNKGRTQSVLHFPKNIVKSND